MRWALSYRLFVMLHKAILRIKMSDLFVLNIVASLL